MKIIPEGFSETINFRDAEYFFKCPLKYEFERRMRQDLNLALYKALDDTIAYSALQFLTDTISTKRTLKAQLKRNLLTYTNVREKELLDGILESRGYRLIENYHAVMESVVRTQAARVGPFPTYYSRYGLTIEIRIPLSLMMRNSKRPSKTRFIVIEYKKTSAQNVHGYGRLWAIAAREAMLEKYGGDAKVGVLNLDNKKGKVFYPLESPKSMITVVLDNMCISLAAKTVYPRYSNDCFSCIYVNKCSEAITA